jgi:DNA replication protein DnaC
MTDYTEQQKLLIATGRAIPLVVDGLPNSHCPNCHDAGYTYIWEIEGDNRARNNPGMGKMKWNEHDIQVAGQVYKKGWYMGETKSGQCPACGSGSMRSWLTKRSGLSGAELGKTLGNFTAQPGKAEAFNIAAELLSNRQPAGFFTFWGGYGTGKSHLLKGIVNGFVGQDILSKYYIAVNMLEDIRAQFGDDRGDARAVIQALSDYRVLCLDEFDRVNMTGWAMQTMFQILEARYNARDEILTVLATNKTPWELPAEFGYLSSRMTGGTIVEVAGADMRPVLQMAEAWA